MNYLKVLVLSTALALTACASTLVPYVPQTPREAPEKAVERILHEQATDAPVERVSVSKAFFEYAEPTTTERRLMVLRDTIQHPVQRVYYRSIENVRMYLKRGAWSVVIEAKGGREVATVSPASEADAKLLVDALEALRKP
ncbi:hypothetical protein [Variovorax arabinosiphilus]|uniref:hypothetical protein n=1 Tax=Variovorax arabinosiphilus TaxID=3053498 RepID=UPI0025783F6C|nr:MULTISPECIES: hypothetical protein [unclassified Variovorax]MDM0118863.1 hypothetical protein [Variovorax sp. J2L1-78]MDM0129288.1 hypothetical protein [Variovorax sp. J2L1-63]MDM0232925.1 hypothetical protein [Variovorax sp. J2R1-6]